MSAVSETILIPRKITVVTIDINTLQVFVGVKEAGVDDAYHAVGTVGRALVHDAVAVGIPYIARLHHVHAIGNCLTLGGPAPVERRRLLGGGSDDGSDRADWILLNEGDFGIAAKGINGDGG
jgi:hypothetical protein